MNKRQYKKSKKKINKVRILDEFFLLDFTPEEYKRYLEDIEEYSYRHHRYKHYKKNVRTLGGTGYKAEYQNEFGYQRAIISFNKTYGKNDEGNPNLFINNGLFSKIALNWDKIQKTIEEDITERLQNRNEELEAYKKLSNTSNTNKKNKAKDNYEIGF